jgi:hypothetical protein
METTKKEKLEDLNKEFEERKKEAMEGVKDKHI